MSKEITLEVWGDFAAFVPPYAKVERLTSAVPTPSAARGIFSAIYSKPAEFYWQITRIEVLNPIRYISFKRNEVKSTVSIKGNTESCILYADEDRTQRQTQALKMCAIALLPLFVQDQILAAQQSNYTIRPCGASAQANAFINPVWECASSLAILRKVMASATLLRTVWILA